MQVCCPARMRHDLCSPAPRQGGMGCVAACDFRGRPCGFTHSGAARAGGDDHMPFALDDRATEVQLRGWGCGQFTKAPSRGERLRPLWRAPSASRVRRPAGPPTELGPPPAGAGRDQLPRRDGHRLPAGQLAVAALASSTRFVELDAVAWTTNTVRVMAHNISPSRTFDLGTATLSVQVTKRRVP